MANLVAEYLINYFRSLDELQHARVTLRRMVQDHSRPEYERAAAAAAFLDVAELIELLRQAHESFMLQFSGTVRPPSQKVIDDSRRLASDLGREIATRNSAEEILRIITKFVDAWSGLADGGAQPTAAVAGVVKMAAVHKASVKFDIQLSRKGNLAWLESHSKH